MNPSNKSDDFYERLREQLQEDTQWPSLYLYKFIVPTDPFKIQEFDRIFIGTNAQINSRVSSKGTYTSVSIKVTMESPDAVIHKYLEVSNIEGVISL